jgi:hypothetical protein
MIPEVAPFAPPPKLVQKVQVKVAPFEPVPATRTTFVTCTLRDANAEVAKRCTKVQKWQRREQSLYFGMPSLHSERFFANHIA